jgi:hypothetical protein
MAATDQSSVPARLQVVAAALTLDATELKRRGILAPGRRTRGVIAWLGADDQPIAAVAYQADLIYRRRLLDATAIFNDGERSASSRINASRQRNAARSWRHALVVHGWKQARRVFIPASCRLTAAPTMNMSLASE